MDWVNRLSRYNGSKMEVVIEDIAGIDPVAPPTIRTLHHISLSEGTHLQFYFNETQFLAIPVYEDDKTSLEELGDELVFRSHDESAKLIYKLRFH